MDILPSDPVDWLVYFEKTKAVDVPRASLKIGLAFLNKKQKKAGLAVDLGTETGRDAIYLLRNHWQVLAIDYSQEAIDILLRRAKRQKLTQLSNMFV